MDKKVKIVLWIACILAGCLATFLVLKSESALVANPKGIMARKELELILLNIFLMSIVTVPTFALLFHLAWRYHERHSKLHYKPDHSHGTIGEIILWCIPLPIIGVMIYVNLGATHELDPYKPLKSDVKPLLIQVVALDWKWLFIYPEQGIATVNFVQFPALTPIQFVLTADGSPMNSFWIPQLSGQIYSMTGMVTPLHLMADEPGEYSGKAAEMNGRGYADMTFIAKSSTPSDFDEWVKKVQKSPLSLTKTTYKAFTKPSVKHPVTLYSHVEEGLFHQIVTKYLHPAHS